MNQTFCLVLGSFCLLSHNQQGRVFLRVLSQIFCSFLLFICGYTKQRSTIYSIEIALWSGERKTLMMFYASLVVDVFPGIYIRASSRSAAAQRRR